MFPASEKSEDCARLGLQSHGASLLQLIKAKPHTPPKMGRVLPDAPCMSLLHLLCLALMNIYT